MKKEIIVSNFRNTFVETEKEALKQADKLLKSGYDLNYFNIESDEDNLPQYVIKATFNNGDEG